jgi:hypothetical protein
MTWKSYAAVSGAGLLATFLASSPPALSPGRAPAARPTEDAGAVRLSDDIEAQAARLGSRVRDDVAYRPPTRNPFRFGARIPLPRSSGTGRSAPSESPPLTPAEPAPEPPPPPSPIRLTGVATNTVNGEAQRVAVLLTSSGVVEARAGDMAGAYRVLRVEEDAVEVVGPDGMTRRVNLRP